MTENSTRERIVIEALRLFGERGYRRTTVGDIEKAAGLSPRSGGLYKHFPSKEAVLEAALERHVAELDAMHSAMDMMPLGDLRAELTLLVRWGLRQLEGQRWMARLLHGEGRDFPELLEEAHERIVRRGYREASDFIRRKIGEGAFPEMDADAISAVIVGAIVNYSFEAGLFGAPPADVDEDRFVDALVGACLALAGEGAAQKEVMSA